MKTAAGRRRFTHGRGLGAERMALVWLMLKGYRPLARRFVGGGCEIDLIVKRGRVIAFCEVKARADLEDALHAIDPRKVARLRRGASAWLARNAWAADHDLRGDAVFVTPNAWPRHLADAFPLGLG